MNGFIYFGNGSVPKVEDANFISPMTAEVRSESRSVAGGQIFLWGAVSGDVNMVSTSPETFLILNGYVSEINGGKKFASQSEAASQLLSLLISARSEDEIASVSRRLYGSFGICLRDGARNRLICISDRVGSRPLWMRREKSGWIVSSHPMTVALSVSERKLDRTALGAFLLYGGAIRPTRSLFQDVWAVEPGTISTLDDSGSTRSNRWYQFRHQPDAGKSIGDWVDLAAERLTAAAARLSSSGSQQAVFFSGGVDSRLTVSALKAAGGNPLLVSLGDGENLEVRVARMAAKAMGLRHEVILRDPEWYLRAFPRAVYEAGGSYVFTHGHFSAAAIQAQKTFGPGEFYLGDLCEAFSKLFCSEDGVGGRLWTADEFLSVFDSIRLPLYRPEDRVGTMSLIKATVRAEMEELLRREIRERYASIAEVSKEPLVLGDHCFRWESAPTLPTFYMFVDVRSAVAERNVMFDAGVQELLETMPAHVRGNSNLGARLIRRMTPLAAWVPNSNSLLPMCWPPATHKMSKAIKPYFGKIRRKILGDTHRTTGSWPKHSALYLTQPAFRRTFEQTLENGDLFDGDLFDRDAIRNCWRAFAGGDMRRAGDVEKLAQLGRMSALLRVGGKKYFDEASI